MPQTTSVRSIRGKGSMAQRCNICGAFPAGVHFGGLSCEGCMAFFKRNVEKSGSLRCYFGRSCELMVENVAKKERSKFTRCKACRYQKCLDEGMNPQVAVRGKHYAKKVETTTTCESDESSSSTPPQKRTESVIVALKSSSSSAQGEAVCLRANSIIERLVHLHLTVLDVGSLIQRVSDMRPGKENYLPPCLRQYHTLLQPRDALLQDTAHSVERAAFHAFHDQIESWKEFMYRALTYQEVPSQPEQSVELMIGYLAVALSDQQSRTATFASLLPGYQHFDALKDRHVLAERFSEVFVIHYSAYVENDELYVQIGPRKAHLCRYWRDQLLNKDYHRLSWPLICELKSLELTMSERYVLLAASLFKPSSTTETGHSRDLSPGSDGASMQRLHQLYLRVLEYLIRSRSTEAHTLVERLEAFLGRLDTYQQLRNQYLHKPPQPQQPLEPAIFSAVLSPDEGIIP